MTPEEANAVVEDAIAKGMAKHGAIDAKVEQLAKESATAAEFRNLTMIYMAELSDWTIQLAYLIADQRWEDTAQALTPANRSMQKLAGAVSKLIEHEQQRIKSSLNQK